MIPLILAQLAQQEVPTSLLGWLTGSAVTVLAFITWAWMTGRIHSDKDHQRIVTENEELRTELRQRNEEDRQTLIPTLVRATDVLAQYLERRTGDTPPPANKPIGR
jgi:hypothetical protein